jgi:hypothetical protein
VINVLVVVSRLYTPFGSYVPSCTIRPRFKAVAERMMAIWSTIVPASRSHVRLRGIGIFAVVVV